jgi:Domain of unknown function (DUF5666)
MPQETSMTTDPTPPPVTGPAFTARTGAPNRLRVLLVLGAALLLIVAAAATSFAASSVPSGSSGGAPAAVLVPDDGTAVDPGAGRFGGRGGFGDITIAAISGNDLTLQTADGWRRTITITSTVELTKGGQPVAVSALNVGDQVRFRQTRNDDGTYTVTAVAVVVPSIRGEASAITSSGFKVTTRDGSVWTVTVSGSTAYQYGQGTGSLADVKDGQTVRVSGTVSADNQMTAITVRVAGDRAVGTVTAKTADTITIKRRDGSSLTIHVDADTTFRVRGAENATLADVAVDMAIGVTGRARADGSIDADVVAAGKLRGFGFGRGGDKAPAASPGTGSGFVLPELGLPDLELPDVDDLDEVGVPTA